MEQQSVACYQAEKLRTANPTDHISVRHIFPRDFWRWRQTSVKEEAVILSLRTNIPTCFVRFAFLTLAVILAACGNDAGTAARIKPAMRGLLDLGDIGFYTQPPELAIPTNIP